VPERRASRGAPIANDPKAVRVGGGALARRRALARRGASNRAGEVLGHRFGISAAQRGHSALTSSPFLLVAPAAVPIVGVTGCSAIDVVAGRRVVHADADDRGVLLEHPRNAHDMLVAGVRISGHSGRRGEPSNGLVASGVEGGVGQGWRRGERFICVVGRVRALANVVDVVDDVLERLRASLRRDGSFELQSTREWAVQV
jgi:hypothetical protein